MARRLLVVVISGCVLPLSGTVLADDGAGLLTRYTSQIDNIENAVARLAREYANPMAILRRFPEQKRLIDARVFYELGNYESAAIMLMDVLDVPSFRGNLEYESANLLLGKSLLKLGNTKAATEALQIVTGGRDRRLAEEARFYLIEMALTDGSEEALRRIVRQLGGTATSDRTRYGLGKAYLRLQQPDQAILWLQVIGAESEFYARARYYLAVAYTARDQLTGALSVFQELTAISASSDEERELVDLAHLAVGRLQIEQGLPDKALLTYQNISRNSPHYEVALYEMSWGYITQEQYDKALQTVDILLLVVKDEQINVDAHVLRGRLNVMMNDYDEALESYTAILDRFAPVRNELSRFIRDRKDIQSYFQWLLTRKTTDAELQAPLSDRTAKWVESTDAIGRVAKVFDRISTEADDIETARSVGEDLERILTSKNRVELFPSLKQGWTRCLALENQLLIMSTRMLDTQSVMVQGHLSAADTSELNELITWRKSLEEKTAKLPTSYEAYVRRQALVDERYLDLERKGFMVEQNLAEVKRQLLALEKYINDKQFADDGDKLSAEREASLRTDIEAEKSELRRLFDELSALKRTIEIAARSIGTGDVATEGEENLKQSLSDAHTREGLFYDRLGLRLGGDLQTTFDRFTELRKRLNGSIGRLDGVIAAIDEQVATKAVELRAQVQREMSMLGVYAGDASIYDSEGQALADIIGEDLFKRAQRRMDEVVLEADVGLLDVVWERKNEKTREIQNIGSERAQRFRQMVDDLKALKEGTTDTDGAAAAGEAR